MNEEKDPNKKLDVIFAPSFYESLEKLPPEEREEAMKAVMEMLPKIQENPSLATPLYGGPIKKTTNWFKRQYRRIRPRK